MSQYRTFGMGKATSLWGTAHQLRTWGWAFGGEVPVLADESLDDVLGKLRIVGVGRAVKPNRVYVLPSPVTEPLDGWDG